MDENAPDDNRYVNVSIDNSKSAVNSLILDYYQKFGKKRDLEQFFSLSTAQSDIRDPASSFWRKMKSHGDTSESGDGKPETPTELCRISIQCTLPESSSSQDENFNSKDESESPPIINEDPVLPLQTDQDSTGHSDNESLKHDENYSQKSAEVHLDLSTNRPFSPTSSLNSQRKLEWDSLGDVGYGNESERKVSGSSLSTLERLALHQQYSNNDTKESQYGAPTSHSTPVDENLNMGKKGHIRKTLKVHKKDIDIVELNVPQSSDNNPGAINVNLTKHISFNVDKDGDITMVQSKENIKHFNDKVSVETEMTPQIKIDREMQTSSTLNKSQSTSPIEIKGHKQLCEQKFPIMISLNTLKKHTKRKKFRYLKKKLSTKGKRKFNCSKRQPEKTGNHISEAESFEYMPGHIYNQNQVQNDDVKDSNSVGNKSSLESSGPITTDSSKATINSFTKDLEKSIDLLKKALHPKYDNSNLKEKLIKEVVQRLLSKTYRDDNSAHTFLSDLSFTKKMGVADSFPTSTSDENNVEKSNVMKKPKKSILRTDKFNPSGMASTSQSTPNLHTLVQNENSVNILKTSAFSNTESDYSSRERNSSDTITKLSSEELYKKYLEALKREKMHKKVLKDKEVLLKSKLVSSDTCLKKVPETCEKSKERLYKLIKELARNNDDGSGDANKLKEESFVNKYKFDNIGKQRSHSVFTLASGKLSRSANATNNTRHNVRQSTEGRSNDNNNDCGFKNYPASSKVQSAECIHQNRNNETDNKLHTNCCHREPKSDSASNKCIHSNKSSPRCVENVVIDNTRDVQYVCLCPGDSIESLEVPNKLLIYKCTGIGKQGICLANTVSKESTSIGVQCSSDCLCGKQIKDIKLPSEVPHAKCTSAPLQCGRSSTSIIQPSRKASTSSQTNSNLDTILGQTSCARSVVSMSPSERNKQEACTREDKEVTRSIQTEINIDPKISEPTLADIKFVNDTACIQIGSEQTMSKKASSSHSNKVVFDKVITKQPSKCNDSRTSPRIPDDGINKHNNENISNNVKTSTRLTQQPGREKIPNLQDPKSYNEKFSIPIQGTNMTLVVSLGSNMEDDTELKKDLNVKTKGVINKQNPNNVNEGSSKGVQCTSTDIFPQIDNDRKQNSRDTNTKSINTCNNNDAETFVKDSRTTNTHLNEDCCKYNTYPKREPSAKKPFERSNTDTDRLLAMCSNLNKNSEINIDTRNDCCSDGIPKDKNICNNKKDVQGPAKVISEKAESNNCQYSSQKSNVQSRSGYDDNVSNDPLLNIIQDITKRYTKKDIESSSRKKCFKEIITVLNYLLDTEDSSDGRKGCAIIESKSDVSNQDGGCAFNRYQGTSNECSRKCCGEHANKKTYVDKCIQLRTKSKKHRTCTESSDFPTSSELPTTSTDTATCKVLSKIRQECERYHQKKCKSGQKRCEESTTTTVNCERCNRQHHCSCRSKCKIHKTKSGVEKGKKKCVAYNLIIQTSDSLVSEETANHGCRPLQNVVVKVPPKSKNLCNAPFKEVAAKIERKMPNCRPRDNVFRSSSLPNESEMSSEEFANKMHTCTVRDYLEMNRPDFVEKSSKRQSCLKLVNQLRPDDVCSGSGYKMIVVHAPECNGSAYVGPCNTFCSTDTIIVENMSVEQSLMTALVIFLFFENISTASAPKSNDVRFGSDKPTCGKLLDDFPIYKPKLDGWTNERADKRKLLLQQLERQQALNSLSGQEIQQLARELGAQLRRKKVEPKFISEHEMKKHSEKIYKSLPEVLKKKAEVKKENLKKTNLLMANIFKKNLQKKTLRGSVNLSNYSAVLKI